MADENEQLPEGTDKIIAGASSTGTDATSAATDTALANPAPKPDLEAPWTGTGQRTGSGPRSDTGSDQPIAERLRSGGEKLQGQAADKARGLVGQGLERSSEALANVSRMIGDTASGIDDRLGTEYGDYARRAASAIDGAANSLASKNPDELIDDTRGFVRRSPGIALAGAAVVGFAVARLLKSSLGGTRDDGGNRSRRDD